MRACGGNCLGMRNEELGIRNYIGPRRSLPLCRVRPPGRAGPSPWGEGGPVRTLGRMRGRQPAPFVRIRRGGPMWPPAKPSPHRGEGGPQGRMRGRARQRTPYVGRDDPARQNPAPAESSGTTKEHEPVGRGTTPPIRGRWPKARGGRGLPPPPCRGAPMCAPSLSLRRGFRRATSLVRGRLFVEAFLWPPLMRGLSAVRLTGGEKTVGDRRRGGRRAPLRMMTHPMWRGLLDAPTIMRAPGSRRSAEGIPQARHIDKQRSRGKF